MIETDRLISAAPASAQEEVDRARAAAEGAG